MRAIERAFNLLANPDLRSCYDSLLLDGDAPAVFPLGGFGSLAVAGELSADRELPHAPFPGSSAESGISE
jgi:hypothetical protein